jgi:hypothetical protein
MATKVSVVLADARKKLKEETASFWSDAELLGDFQKGVDDLWGAIVDLQQEHYLTVDETRVTMDVDATILSGVPDDCFRVELIEPRDTTSGSSLRDVLFFPRDYKSPEMRNARALTSQDPSSGLYVFYALSQAGSPIGAPTVHVAPKVSTQIPLRFAYTRGPRSESLTVDSINPIPGESNNALRAWVIAYARAKEREDRSPDPNWLAVYATEKQNILVRLTPRQSQEPEVVDDLFAGY